MTAAVHCTACDTPSSIPVHHVTLAVSVDGHHVRFECPTCRTVNVHRYSPRIYQLLLSAGCHLEIQPGELRDPARTDPYPLTGDDVAEMAAAFDRPDVFDLLTRP